MMNIEIVDGSSATIDTVPAGTAAFRPLPEREGTCEAKRLYVRPAD